MDNGKKWNGSRALLEIADRTQSIFEQQGADQIAALAFPQCSTSKNVIYYKNGCAAWEAIN